MIDDISPQRLQRYLLHRRRYEIGLWLCLLLLNTAANTAVEWMELAREGRDLARWKPLVWETSSSMLFLILLPLLLVLDARFPLSGGQFRRNLPWHLLATVPFSLIHVVGMVGLRKLAYATAGASYDFGHWPSQLLYEYLKDARSYGSLLAFIYLYRLLLLRLQGEARVLAPPDVGPPVEPIERPGRFLVRKLGKEFLIAAADIEWLQAEGNYVNLHLRGRLYPLRSTLAAVEAQLDPARFLRVHRSYIINLDQLAEIRPLDSGDAQLRLKDGTVVACSRRYRTALRARGRVVPGTA